MTPETISLEAVLEKICNSPGFRRSHRLQRFLRYVVQSSVERPGEPPKEYSIATAVYDKGASFDPQSDPIIRVEAIRLRSRLLEYYTGPGRDDPVAIDLPKGSYSPVIVARSQPPHSTANESIAVIPFNDIEDPDVQYLIDGLSESLTSRLARISQLRVAPWTMVLRLKVSRQDFAGAAKELGVRTVLTLRLVVRGEAYEAHVEWLDPEHKTHLWGARYDRQLTDLYSLEDEIAVDLAERITPQLTRTQIQELRKQQTNDGQAYQLYLKGRYFWNKRTSDALFKAIQHFRRALDRDAGFALALTGMADSYFNLGTFGFLSPADSLPLARSAAMRALEIDTDLAEALTTLAAIHAISEWDWPAAEREFQEAIALAPKYSIARQWYGAVLCAIGRFAAGLKLLRSALDADPLSPMIATQLAVGYYLERRYEDAMRICGVVLEMDPQFWPALLFLGLCLEQEGRREEAISRFRAAAEYSADGPMAVGALGHALAQAGDPDAALKLLLQLEACSAVRYVPPWVQVLIWCGLGRIDAALDYLERALAERSTWIGLFLKGEPRLDLLRQEPRFQEMLQAARLV